MEFYHFAKLVREAKMLGAKEISVFGYGEPLLDPDIASKIGFVTRLGLKSDITTNASLLTFDMSKKLLESGLSSIRFSVHGLKYTYEKVHKGLNWLVTSNNIADFLKMNDSTFRHACQVEIVTIPMHGETVDEIIDYWNPGAYGYPRLRVDYLEIWKPHNWCYGKGYREVKQRKKSCGRPFNGPVQINCDGRMMVCCFDYNAVMTVGNTYNQLIEEILKGKPFEDIRQAHRNGEIDHLPCGECDQLNIEQESPLLWSNRDPSCEVGKTSTNKFKLEEM
jgi:hypothetical protein